MCYRRNIGRALLVLVTWLVFSSASIASDDAFKVIVHRDLAVTSVPREFLRSAFLRKTLAWDHGPAVRPVELAPGSPVRERFLVEVIGMAPAQHRNYWIQRIFSGTAVPPPTVANPAEVIAYVRANRGAVGYIPAAMDPGATKVIGIR